MSAPHFPVLNLPVLKSRAETGLAIRFPQNRRRPSLAGFPEIAGGPRFFILGMDRTKTEVDGENRRDKPIKNDLHYSAEGYKTLGKRFAENALELIEANR